MKLTRLILFLLSAWPMVARAEDTVTPPPGMVRIPGGEYKPLYSQESKPRRAPDCFLSILPVTNGEYLSFVKEHPEWRRSAVDRAMADENYLAHWAGDLDPGPNAGKDMAAPVTGVSWFAARAYCQAHGGRLPLQDEWEFAARADATRLDASTDQEFLRKLLDWYAQASPATLPSVGTAEANVYGLRGLHGLVWEWVHDFNSTLVVGDSRGDDSLEKKLFCGAGSLLASDVSNYAAFMRYAFRSSLKGNYCVRSLGFRMARSIDPGKGDALPPLTSPWDIPATWRDQQNQEVTLGSLRGKVSVLTMGFTSCQYACSRIVGDLQRIEKALGADAEKVRFVFVSIDPARDTPEKMAAFAAKRQISGAGWAFLTGDPESVRELAVTLAFKYQQFDEDFAHSNLIAVLDPAGKVIHREEALGAEITASVAAIRKLLQAP